MQTRQQQFLRSLAIQWRVLSALVRREFITLSNRRGSGLLMLFGEPFVIMIFIMGLVTHGHMKSLSSFPVLPFVLSGWGGMWLCRYPIQRMSGVMIGNASFLYHRNIKPLDIMIARTVVMLFAAAFSFIVIFCIYLGLEQNATFHNPLHIFCAFLFMIWYTFFMSILAIALSSYTITGEKTCILIAVLHVFITGAFFMVVWLPKSYQTFMLIFPMVHATEMMRDGFFGDIVECEYSIPYLFITNLLLTYIALYSTKKLSKTRQINGLLE